MSESLCTKIFKLGFNLFPAFRGTGGRITYIASDFSEIRLKLPLSWRTKNYVRTIYGGSMYGAIDPVYMLMLLKTLGTEYIVWDKAASIHFKKPGRTTLFAAFSLTEDELHFIKRELEEQPKIDRIYTVHLVDKEGNIYATAEKTLHIRKKQRA